ncbi:MAG TPA: hypothetical protein VGU90_00370, partial [Terriglobales bacterium]|nr:hypothetical protein [Terriglobales bacterium]
ALIWSAQFALVAIYCAVADFLYTARLAGYVFIIRGEETAVLFADVEAPRLPGSSAVDAIELILSDVPLPAS